MLLGFAPSLAGQALIVEVYAPAALMMAVLVYLVRRSAPAWLIGLVWGLGLGVHLSLAGAVFWLWLTMDSRRARLTLLGVAGLVTLGLYAWLLPLLGRGAPSPWADMTTLAGWWQYVSASLYHGYVFGLPFAAWPGRLLAVLGWWARQFTPWGALLLVLGLASTRTRAQRGVCLSLCSVTLYAMGYNTPDAWVNLVAYLPLAASLLASGWEALSGRWRHYGQWLMVAGVLLALVWTWPQTCLAGADEAARWANATLLAAPDHAVLCTHADGATFALWYAQARGVRTDVRVVDVDLLAYGPYRAFWERQGEIPDTLLTLCRDVPWP